MEKNLKKVLEEIKDGLMKPTNSSELSNLLLTLLLDKLEEIRCGLIDLESEIIKSKSLSLIGKKAIYSSDTGVVVDVTIVSNPFPINNEDGYFFTAITVLFQGDLSDKNIDFIKVKEQ